MPPVRLLLPIIVCGVAACGSDVREKEPAVAVTVPKSYEAMSACVFRLAEADVGSHARHTELRAENQAIVSMDEQGYRHWQIVFAGSPTGGTNVAISVGPKGLFGNQGSIDKLNGWVTTCRS